MNKIEFKDKIRKIAGSKNFEKVLYVLGALFVVSFIFHAGMIVGFERASFRHDWGNNYERNFGPKGKPPFLNDIKGSPNAHGAIGKIIKIEFPNIVVLDKDQTEKIVIIDDKTNILERKDTISKEELTLDKYVIVIGTPNANGQIEAKLIRVIPSPEEMMKNDVSMMGDRLPFDLKDKNI